MKADLVPIPRPGDDIVPDGWWRSAVVPWADKQRSTNTVAQAAAKLAGLEAAYRTLNADTSELTKARRYLEHRWGVLLGPGDQVKTGPGRNASVATETLKDKNARSAMREMAWHRDGTTTRKIVLTVLETRRDSDTLSRAKVLRAIREAIADERRSEEVDDLIVDDVEIRHGDFRECLRDLCGTVDAVITDPPYNADWVPMFDDLGELAANLLGPDGVLAVLTGQTFLPQYLDHLSTWLEYRWTGAYLTHGPRTRVHHAAVGTGWKPVLIFQLPDAPRRFILDDVFRSNADDKRHHHWGQSETGTGAIVERLTSAGQLVVDPCLGGGTTAIVCRDLGRRFVGCDIDADAVLTAQERLS